MTSSILIFGVAVAASSLCPNTLYVGNRGSQEGLRERTPPVASSAVMIQSVLRSGYAKGRGNYNITLYIYCEIGHTMRGLALYQNKVATDNRGKRVWFIVKDMYLSVA